LLCRVSSRTPGMEAWCRGYGLASCKPVYPFPLSCSALPGA
jgi:hypothetical protein